MTVRHGHGYSASVFPPAVAAGGADMNEASLTQLLEDLLCRFFADHEDSLVKWTISSLLY